jgi:hypothetical protein
MKYPLGGLIAAVALIFAIEALAQSEAPQSSSPKSQIPQSEAPQSPSPQSTPVIQTVTAPAAPVNPSRRYACRAASQKFQGQERTDQMQLCMAQSRVDCLKQAIDQKIVGRPRWDFVQSCVGE